MAIKKNCSQSDRQTNTHWLSRNLLSDGTHLMLDKHVINRCNTDLGKISISGEVETGKVHGETTVHVHLHISSGAGSAAVQVVLPKGKTKRW